NTETLKVMLDYGADINIRDSLQQTLLMDAFFSSAFEHMTLLLNRGANPNPVNINNLSLLTAVNRQIKDSQDGSEYNEQCKKILELMLLKGAKEAQ
ncbi:TPA: ankyrin repeat domain-containing protein, partial [Serratia marcescens]